MHVPNVFKSFFMGGFECSTHRRDDGVRLDLISATRHDVFAAQDYAAMRAHGIASVRDGLRWHLIERRPGEYDWSSFLPMLRTAREAGLEVIWDLCHYGWPEWLSIWSPAFVDRFAAYTAAVARLVRDEGIERPFYCPVNEISYWAWAGGDMGLHTPVSHGRGCELKTQLVRAAIAATEAVRTADPRARFIMADPAIHVAAASDADRDEAERMRQAQFEAWDMVAGRRAPELGGRPEHLDIVGINYYSNNQWYLGGGTIKPADRRYRPLHHIIREIHERYARPILVAETGAEGDARSLWLQYVCGEVLQAMEQDVPVEGICLYPIVDYPGWTNDRHCETGLLCFADDAGHRRVYRPLAQQLAFQQARFEQLRAPRTTAQEAAAAW